MRLRVRPSPRISTATVTVKVGAPTVTTVDSIADISVANGTPLEQRRTAVHGGRHLEQQ